MNNHTIRVFSDERTDPNVYTVLAPDELSARCIAFLLDGGCEPFMTNWDQGHIELAKTWTTVVKPITEREMVGENCWNPPGIVFTIKDAPRSKVFEGFVKKYFRNSP